MDKYTEDMKKYFEDKYLKGTCFDTLEELLADKTLIDVNAPRAVIAINLKGIWYGLIDEGRKDEIARLKDNTDIGNALRDRNEVIKLKDAEIAKLKDIEWRYLDAQSTITQLRIMLDKKDARIKELDRSSEAPARARADMREVNEKMSEVQKQTEMVLKVNAELVNTNTGLMNENEELKKKITEKNKEIQRIRKECMGCEGETCADCPNVVDGLVSAPEAPGPKDEDDPCIDCGNYDFPTPCDDCNRLNEHLPRESRGQVDNWRPKPSEGGK